MSNIQPRRPAWWVLITEPKLNRLVMPPMRITDVPYSDPTKERNFRSYKLQFQAPPNVATYSWKVQVVSDTFLGEEVIQDIVVSTPATSFQEKGHTRTSLRLAKSRRCLATDGGRARRRGRNLRSGGGLARRPDGSHEGREREEIAGARRERRRRRKWLGHR